jgi:predicted Zn-ribbon and HTH transcriptional regulator
MDTTKSALCKKCGNEFNPFDSNNGPIGRCPRCEVYDLDLDLSSPDANFTVESLRYTYIEERIVL